MAEKPLNIGFNMLVDAMAENIAWEAVDTEHPGFEAMRQDYLNTGVLKVNSDHSENTIFGYPEVNHAFRAWHDHCHLLANADFSREGERAAAELQIKQMKVFMEGSPVIPVFEKLIYAEVVGQADYFFETGKFPDNQREWTEEFFRNIEGMPV